MTLDQGIALGIGIPGSVAAIVAAVYAVRADRFVRKDSAANLARRNSDLQPRLQVGWAGGPSPVRLINVGGAAQHFIWVGQDDQLVKVVSGAVGPHTMASLVFQVTELGIASYRSGIGTILLIAEDIDGRWWDCRSGHVLPMAVEDYLDRRMAQVGLGNLAAGLRSHLPRRMPIESLRSLESLPSDEPTQRRPD